MNDKQRGRRPKVGGAEWNRRAQDVMARFSPRILPCTHCEQPVADGWMCTWCGEDPSEPPETTDDAKSNEVRVKVSKAGVRTVDASDIINSSGGQKAIRLMREIAEKL